MGKIKLTRNELKAQRVALARYTRFLPTLELKKLQLEVERRKVEKEIKEVQDKLAQLRIAIKDWEKMFNETVPKSVDKLVHVQKIAIGESNIAGLTVPVFQEVIFQVDEYDYSLTPPWIDQGIETIKEIIRFREWLRILEQQREVITIELRRTTQRINLFKERLIPECKENIRVICIHLGDMQAAAVGRAKIAKQKIQKRQEQSV